MKRLCRDEHFVSEAQHGGGTGSGKEVVEKMRNIRGVCDHNLSKQGNHHRCHGDHGVRVCNIHRLNTNGITIDRHFG